MKTLLATYTKIDPGKMICNEMQLLEWFLPVRHNPKKGDYSVTCKHAQRPGFKVSVLSCLFVSLLSAVLEVTDDIFVRLTVRVFVADHSIIFDKGFVHP